jgi:hypothetical protein
MLSYRRFQNVETGEFSYAPAGRVGRFYNSVRKIKQFIFYNWKKFYIAHVTMTVAVAEEGVFAKELNRALTFIRMRLERDGVEFLYAAVKEVQYERLKKRGECVIHYHVLCFYSVAYAFPAAEEIEKSWGLGNVKITAPKLRLKVNSLVGYLSKYMGKGFEFEALDVKKGFSTSQVAQIYKLNPGRLQEVIKKVGVHGAKLLKCSFTKVWRPEVARLRERMILFDWWGKTLWVNAGVVYGEPF